MKLSYIEISPRDTYNGNGAKELQRIYPDAEISIPTLPADPLEALSALKVHTADYQPDIVIGVGIGGTLVQNLRGQYRILINPIFVLPQFLGDVCVCTPDGDQTIMFTPQQQEVLHQMLDHQFEHLPYGEEQYIYALFAGNDDFLLYSETFFKQHYKYNFNYDGNPILTPTDWEENIVPVVSMLGEQKNGVIKPVVYVDMDNVLVDFQSGVDALTEEEKTEYAGRYDEVPNIFSRMKPMPGAIEAFKALSHHYDMYILSTAPWANTTAWKDKVMWVKKYLGIYGYKRLILSHRKDLSVGCILIDDRARKGAAQFEGTWLQFGKEPTNNWEATVKYLLSEEPIVSNGDASDAEDFSADQRPILYLDMDNVLVDFANALANKLTPEEKEKYRDHYDDVPDIFSRMEPIEGAVEAFHQLSERYNIFILSTAPWDNNNAWSDKVKWVNRYLGEKAKKHIVLSHHKNLQQGSYLIDDSSRNGAKEFCGKWFQFGKAPYENWEKILKQLI